MMLSNLWLITDLLPVSTFKTTVIASVFTLTAPINSAKEITCQGQQLVKENNALTYYPVRLSCSDSYPVFLKISSYVRRNKHILATLPSASFGAGSVFRG